MKPTATCAIQNCTNTSITILLASGEFKLAPMEIKSGLSINWVGGEKLIAGKEIDGALVKTTLAFHDNEFYVDFPGSVPMFPMPAVTHLQTDTNSFYFIEPISNQPMPLAIMGVVSI